MTDAELDCAIFDAHRAGDAAALAQLYLDAATRKRGEEEAHCFLLVQAYVFALESGSPLADDLHSRLKLLGREA